jgi:hypothetical protein
MIDREKVQHVKSRLEALRAVSIQEGHDMLTYLLHVAEMECQDLIDGRFDRSTRVEEFAATLQ